MCVFQSFQRFLLVKVKSLRASLSQFSQFLRIPTPSHFLQNPKSQQPQHFPGCRNGPSNVIYLQYLVFIYYKLGKYLVPGKNNMKNIPLQSDYCSRDTANIFFYFYIKEVIICKQDLDRHLQNKTVLLSPQYQV